ncbi:MAG: DUF4402 domain-containing protein [Ignavibacteriae bacterium]|nr:DUF4402 domain-containing protein [Ignavibacteriota bacterium]
MKSKGRFISGLVFLIILTGSIFAQSTASIDEPVSINIQQGLSMSKVAGDLEFGDYISTGSDGTVSKTPADGVNFEVLGTPGAITVTFADATLNDGGANNLTFVPNVEETGGSNTYVGANTVTTGGSVNLVDDAGEGKLYLWVGGNIDVLAATPIGAYTGTFTLSVAY